MSLVSSKLMGCADERSAEAEAEMGWPVEFVVAGVLEGPGEMGSVTRGGNSGMGRFDFLAISTARS